MMSRLWVPHRDLWCPGLGAQGSSGVESWYQPPSTFHFPTTADYTSGMAGAVTNLFSWGSQEMSAALSPPGKSSATGLRASLEAAAGVSIGQLVSSAIASQVGGTVAKMMTDLVEGFIDAIVEQVVASVGKLIGDAVGSVPVLGQIAGLIVDIVVTLVNTLSGPSAEEEAAAVAQAQSAATELARTMCGAQQAAYNNLRPTGWNAQTQSAVLTPADMFRPMAYVAHEGWSKPGTMQRSGSGYVYKGVPWGQTMFFAALCGGEDQRLFWQSRGHYNDFITRSRRKWNDPNLGIPAEAQRRMKMLLNGIMASVQDPELPLGGIVETDGGRSLFPLLVDLIWSFYKDNQRRSPVLAKELPGYWDERLLFDIAGEFAACTDAVRKVGEASARRWACCHQMVDIVGTRSTPTGFMRIFAEYELGLVRNFGDSYGNLDSGVTNQATIRKMAMRPKRGALVISSAVANRAAKSLVAEITVPQKILLATAGLGGSYLAYRGVKTGVKLVRKRRALRGKQRGR